MAGNELPKIQQHLFTVRLWAETNATALTQWRGLVEHIATGQKFYFTSLGDMQDFIALQLAASEKPVKEA